MLVATKVFDIRFEARSPALGVGAVQPKNSGTSLLLNSIVNVPLKACCSQERTGRSVANGQEVTSIKVVCKSI